MRLGFVVGNEENEPPWIAIDGADEDEDVDIMELVRMEVSSTTVAARNGTRQRVIVARRVASCPKALSVADLMKV